MDGQLPSRIGRFKANFFEYDDAIYVAGSMAGRKKEPCHEGLEKFGHGVV